MGFSIGFGVGPVRWSKSLGGKKPQKDSGALALTTEGTAVSMAWIVAAVLSIGFVFVWWPLVLVTFPGLLVTGIVAAFRKDREILGDMSFTEWVEACQAS